MMQQNTLTSVLLATFLLGNTVKAQQQNTELPLIPYPQEVHIGEGIFTLSKNDLFHCKNYFSNADESFLQSLKNKFDIKNTSKKSKVLTYYSDASLPQEAYDLQVFKDSIVVRANSKAGIFYANQTLEQLLYFYGANGQLSLPTLHIQDQPKYAWRGFMLDVARHFFTMDYLKKTIDRMSFYKANKLHLHLTDDQGWRVEIKQYPLLTKIGAWRSFNNHDSLCMENAKENPDFVIDPRMIKTEKNGSKIYGGYYTQAQLKELVAYAAKKNIEIIPEIDMPGHFNAAIRAYPFLTGTSKAGWGKDFSVPINPCQENVYAFTQNVLKEIFALFPSRYIHLGADEVEKTTWSNNDACKQLMTDSNIHSVDHLQSYFVHRMQKFVEANGKKLITWDDALEGGLNSQVTVMYWRTWVKKAPAEALLNGNPLIMSPGEPLYFDAYPDKNSVFNVYHKKITTDNIDRPSQLLGGQANLWTEKIPSEARADYLVYPRYLALMENLWTNKQSQYNSFLSRLDKHYELLDKMGVQYRLPDLNGFLQENVFIDTTSLQVRISEKDRLYIHYTLDGNLPTTQSPTLPERLVINKNETVKIAAFTSSGHRGDIYTIHYKKVKYQSGIVPDTILHQGLKAQYYKGFFKSTNKIKSIADSSFTTSTVTVPSSINAPSFGLDYSGYIDIPTTGIYSFYLTCDDGGILKIGNELIVDNDGLHSAQEKSGQAALSKGLHPILLRFIEGGGGFTLKLQYSFNGSEPQDIPETWLRH
ncbi:MULTISPECIES: family 20 glycosylhydrolase [Chitinophagaceae]